MTFFIDVGPGTYTPNKRVNPTEAPLTSCAGGHHNMPHPCKLIFDLLILKVVSESGETWATSIPILVFLGLSVLDLGPM